MMHEYQCDADAVPTRRPTCHLHLSHKVTHCDTRPAPAVRVRLILHQECNIENLDVKNNESMKRARSPRGKHIHDLDDWMASRFLYTHPDLRVWPPRYSGSQGRELFVDLEHLEGSKMSQNMRIVGNTRLTRLGGNNSLRTEGKLTIALSDTCNNSTCFPPQLLLLDDLRVEMKELMLIVQLLTLTHTHSGYVEI
eukprot:scaffold22544_cov78-Skeletonema_dohrnii-CCMP3373.AAC.3